MKTLILTIPLLLFTLPALGVTAISESDSVSGGIAVNSSPALSIQFGKPFKEAVHITAWAENNRSKASCDVQKMMVPTWGYGVWYKAALYAGGGIEGSAVDDGSKERYFLRAPLGIQAELRFTRYVRPSVFAEIAPRLGTLPNIGFSRVFTTGFRASF